MQDGVLAGLSYLSKGLSRYPLTFWGLYDPNVIQKVNLFRARVLSPYVMPRLGLGLRLSPTY